MQVILLEKVVNLGGSAMWSASKMVLPATFSFPRAWPAVPPKPRSKISKRVAPNLEKVQAEKLAAAQAVGAKLSGLVVEMSQKAGVDGRLFGSVTNFDIAEALKAKGIDVAKACVRLPLGPLKMVGEHSIQVAPHTDVVADVTIRVIGETA
jgi:large subunit ribosomal protein L9